MERHPHLPGAQPLSLPEFAAIAALAAVAALCWAAAVREMAGMDMGVETAPGPLAFFLVAWLTMMAAMMLPGAIPMAARHARVHRRAGHALLFAASYLAVWAVIGIVVYPIYQPHGTAVAGGIVVAAGIYELTPLKRHFRRCCREGVPSGLDYGLNCVGSSAGLMLVLLALGAMSVTWMAAVALVVLAQKLLPPRAAIDVPVGLAIVALGLLVLAAPAVVPGIMPM